MIDIEHWFRNELIECYLRGEISEGDLSYIIWDLFENEIQ